MPVCLSREQQTRQPINTHSQRRPIPQTYDKTAKSFVYQVERSGHAAKIELPNPHSRMTLGLVQPHVVIQYKIAQGSTLSIEFSISDQSGTRRRIVLSSTQRASKITPLFARLPLRGILEAGEWLTLSINLRSLTRGCFGSIMQSINSISFSATCCVRGIFTMRDQPADTSEFSDIYDEHKLVEDSVADIPM